MDKITAVALSIIMATVAYFLTGYQFLFVIVFLWFIFYFFMLPSKLITILGVLWLIYELILHHNNFLYPYLFVISGILLNIIPNRNKKIGLPLLRTDNPALFIKLTIFIIFMIAGFFSFTVFQKQKKEIINENEKKVEKVIITINQNENN